MKKFMVLVASVALLVACDSKPGYKISGTVGDPALNGEYVYLYEYGSVNGAPKDSALVANGAFVFEGQQNDPELYVLSFADDVVKPSNVGPGENDAYSVIFVLDNATLQADLDTVSSVTGTAENDALQAFHKGIDKINKGAADLAEKTKNFNSLSDEEKEGLRQRYETYLKDRMKMAKDYVKDNLHKLSGAYIFSQYYTFMDPNEQITIIDQADSTFKSVPGIQQIDKQLSKIKKVAPGQKFTDFSMDNPEGKTQKLSDFTGKGNYVLVDFWASWCPPCRKEMPHVVELYKKYHNKGLEIVGVSLDQDKDAWIKAIKQMDMTWPQLSDLKGWDNEAALLYGVSSIPMTVLINPEGVIVERGLGGNELEKKLADLLH